MPTRKRARLFDKPVPSCARCPQRHAGVFRGLGPQALVCVDRGRKINQYHPGQIFYAEGNTPLVAFCVQSGLVKLYHVSDDGRQHVLGLAGAGTLLAAGNVLSGLPYGEMAEAVEPTRVCVMDAATLRQLLRTDPGLWEKIIESLCGQLLKVQSGLLGRAHRSARSKLAELLLELHAFSSGRAGKALPFSRQDLADMIGVSQETAIRLLSEFRRRKLIVLKGRQLLVLRPEVLREQTGPAY